jgi:hypothetical protein
MNAPYAPGPWVAERLIDSDDGAPFYLVKNASGCPLARLQHCAEDPAHARLFAASPTLLKALEDLLIDCGRRGQDHGAAFDAGVAAVKKARHG